LQSDPGLARHLIEGGRKTLNRMFSEDAVVNAYINLISAG
jgi:hypothetical protein